MRKISLLLTLVVLAACFTVACSPPPAPPQNTNKPVVKKKDFSADYNKEMNAAFNAQDTYGQDRSDPNYINWYVHCYAALKFVNMHEKENGDGSTDKWSRLTELKRMRVDLEKTNGPKEDAKCVQANKEWIATAH